MAGKEIPVNPRPDVEAFGKRGAHKAAEVMIALFVAAEEDEVGIVAVQRLFLFVQGTRRYIDLTADNRLDAGCFAGFVESHRAVHDAVVRHGEGGHAQLLGAQSDPVDAAGAVEQGVFRMNMEMDETHGDSLTNSAILRRRWERQLFDTGGLESRERSAKLTAGLVIRKRAASFSGSGRDSRPYRAEYRRMAASCSCAAETVLSALALSQLIWRVTVLRISFSTLAVRIFMDVTGAPMVVRTSAMASLCLK